MTARAATVDLPQATSNAHHFERRAMGSPLRLSVSGATAEAAAAAWESASNEFERVEQACSRFRATADLVRLNSTAGDSSGLNVDRLLVRALVAADRAHRITGGRFDARVLGVLEQLGDVALPAAAQTAVGRTTRELDRSSGWRPSGLLVDPRSSRVAVACPVDLGGIGKGLALRWAGRAALAALQRAATQWARPGLLLEAGGDLLAHGQAPGGGPWMIGIEDPAGDADPVAVLTVGSGSVCTSSVRIRSWLDPDGRPVHHLIDPATGRPGGEGLLSVTVAGDDPAWSEVRAKALFLAGVRRIGDTARALDLATWWIDTNGDLGMTPRARLMTAWTR